MRAEWILKKLRLPFEGPHREVRLGTGPNSVEERSTHPRLERLAGNMVLASGPKHKTTGSRARSRNSPSALKRVNPMNVCI